MAIDAYIWRDERRQKQEVALAWRIATLMRAKRLLSLKQLLATGPAKPLRGKELSRRRSEFKEMTANVDVNALVRHKRKPSQEEQ